MPIGTSDGEVFEDEFQWVASNISNTRFIPEPAVPTEPTAADRLLEQKERTDTANTYGPPLSFAPDIKKWLPKQLGDLYEEYTKAKDAGDEIKLKDYDERIMEIYNHLLNENKKRELMPIRMPKERKA